MAPRKFNKNNSTTFSLVYRAQNDPRIHDVDASDMVFTEKPVGRNNNAAYDPYVGGSSASAAGERSKFIPSRDDLDSEFGGSVRDNEGEAAAYGIYYDDSEYDYMQHMRDMGSSDAYFIEAAPIKGKGKMKGKKLEDALRTMDLDDGRSSVASSQVSAAASEYFDEDILPSEFVKKTTYQDMQDVPDALAGFQPDMDPRLREVLEALDDEAYVEDDEEDVFGQLQQTAEEVDRSEFENLDFDDEDGWESDHTVRAGEDGYREASPVRPPMTSSEADQRGLLSDMDATDMPPDHGDGDWLAAFAKAKRDASMAKMANADGQQQQQRLNSSAQRRLELQSTTTGASSIMTGGRKKKRKGAMTSSSGYSMSSSVLSRTEGQGILDRRFDKIEEEYASDDDDDGGVSLHDDNMSVASGFSQMSGMSKMSGMSGLSQMSSWSSASKRDDGPKVLRSDFGDIMDDFLGKYSKVGKTGKHVRKGKPASGMEQLDEVRQGLGPARLKKSAAENGTQKA